MIIKAKVSFIFLWRLSWVGLPCDERNERKAMTLHHLRTPFVYLLIAIFSIARAIQEIQFKFRSLELSDRFKVDNYKTG